MPRLSHSVNTLLQTNLVFALYFEPGNTEPALIVGKANTYMALPADITTAESFIFAPYTTSESCPIYLIKKDHYAVGEDAIKTLTKKLRTDELYHSPQAPNHHNLEKEAYESIVQKAINHINEGEELQKVVLARSFDIPNNFNTGELLYDIKKALPDAFCYLVNIPEQGIWIGATPEQLLEVKDNKAQTNALAGTLPVGSTEEWSAKEIDEQQIVTDYIANNLDAIGINDYTLDGPTTHKSGAVRHIKTVFDFHIKPQQKKRLIETLHPTPAVCGMPKEMAHKMISDLEPVSREYYSGYLGPLNINNESHIFVNLRCMKVNNEKATLFVGAGITAGSNPHKEWDETEVKALTLLNVIRNKEL